MTTTRNRAKKGNPWPGKRGDGFTLLEVLLGAGVGLSILFLMIWMIGDLSGTTRQRTASLWLRSSSETTKQVLARDLARLCSGLPVSYYNGSADEGVDFIGGKFVRWPPQLKASAPLLQSAATARCDQIGFFIRLSPHEAAPFQGKTLAHVLYFTAITADHAPETLSRESSRAIERESRKLFRLFTPPDRVFERLNMIDPASHYGSYERRGAAAIPRGYVSVGGHPLLLDEATWEMRSDLSPCILSLVSARVLLFQVTPSGSYREGKEIKAPRKRMDFREVPLRAPQAEYVLSPATPYYKALESPMHLPEQRAERTGQGAFLRPEQFGFALLFCQASEVARLPAGAWEQTWNLAQLHRSGVRDPLALTFSHHIQP